MEKNTTGTVTMGVFKTDKPLQLIPFPNGGWTIVQQTDSMRIPDEIGAYSNTGDMLDALAENLIVCP